jgi:hypothetical protein
MTLVAPWSGILRAIRNGSRNGSSRTSVETLMRPAPLRWPSREALAQGVEQALATEPVGVVAGQAELV